MMLNGLEVPEHYNGIGLHDTPGSETAAWDYEQSASHARELRAHGVTLYKLFGSGTKGSRAAAYQDNGIVVLHRWWPGGAHWGSPPQEWLMPRADYDYLLSCGVSLFEPGWNEFNIAEEWVTSIPGAAGIARAVLDAWEEAGNRYGGHDQLLFPSNTPGGNVDHRACYQAITAEIVNRGLQGTINHVAIHPRPFNNPPSTTWSATNTVTFDEWRWIRDQFKSIGIDAYYWATEHGYSLGDAQNTNYPPIDLDRWTSYNWDLFVRLNPRHQAAIEPGLAGVTHWFNAGWGHWGPWAKDALVDSPAPEMPAPSPLWIKMGQDPQDLRFSRYDDVYPPPERARGFMVSHWQPDIDFELAKAEGYEYVMIRVSGWNKEHTALAPDELFAQHYERAGAAGLLRGGYYYLLPEFVGQARLFAETIGDRKLEVGTFCDIEENGLTAAKCEASLLASDDWTGLTTGVYINPNWLYNILGRQPWMEGRTLWIAHYGVEEPDAPDWWPWTFWQYEGGLIGEEYCSLDVYNGTEQELHEEYGTGGGEPVEGVRVVDVTGAERDWDWLVATYGDIQIQQPDADAYYKIVEIREKHDDSTFIVKVLNADGSPRVGKGVIFYWDEADPAPGSGWLEQGVRGDTNENGEVGFGMGTGAYYLPPAGGPHKAWLFGENVSEMVEGIGMLVNTNHDHVDVTYQWVEDGEDPETPIDPDLEAVVAQLTRIADSLENIERDGLLIRTV